MRSGATATNTSAPPIRPGDSSLPMRAWPRPFSRTSPESRLRATALPDSGLVGSIRGLSSSASEKPVIDTARACTRSAGHVASASVAPTIRQRSPPRPARGARRDRQRPAHELARRRREGLSLSPLPIFAVVDSAHQCRRPSASDVSIRRLGNRFRAASDRGWRPPGHHGALPQPAEDGPAATATLARFSMESGGSRVSA